MQSLRLFCDVATCRSFSQAAARHGITQSAASQRIGQLEKRLGVTLFDRSVRPLLLTVAGDEFWRGCRDLVARYDRLETRVARLQPAPGGEVVVDAIYSAGIDLLNQAITLFQAQTPDVSVTVNYHRPEEVYAAVREQRCDLGILSYPQRWREVSVIPLRTERMAVVCAPGHALAGRAVVNAADLADLPMVTFEPSLPVGRHIRRYLKDHGVTPTVTNVFDNIDTIKGAVAVTDEYSILPKRTVQREAAAGVLRVVELEPELVRPMGIIYARARRAHGRPFSPAAQAFVDFLLHQAGPEQGMEDGGRRMADGKNGEPSPQPSPGGRGGRTAPSPRPSPEGRGGRTAPSPQPSPGGRGGEEAPSPQPSPGGRGGKAAATDDRPQASQLVGAK